MIFGLWASELLIFDLKIGFLVKNYVYKQLGMSGILHFEEKQPKTIGGNLFSAAGSFISFIGFISFTVGSFLSVLISNYPGGVLGGPGGGFGCPGGVFLYW